MLELGICINLYCLTANDIPLPPLINIIYNIRGGNRHCTIISKRNS
nr:MAG TPA: hypothetical protein [Caudoviricetes sp.]